MKFPQSPPRRQPLFTEVVKRGNFDELARFGKDESHRADRYLHWDEFRHRASDSDGLSREEQWAAIRMSRAIRSQPTPLLGLDGNPFTFFLTQRAFEDLHEIDLHCGGGIGVAADFNHRQLSLLKHALKRPFAAYTVVSHQTSHGVSNQTAKNDLVALETKGLLIRGKEGKAFVYRPVADLSDRLERGGD